MHKDETLVVQGEFTRIKTSELKKICEIAIKLNNFAQEINKINDSIEENEFFVRLPRLEIPDWLCSKQERCVTTAIGTVNERKWNIKECDVEAELVTISYGLKYGTPTSMTKGRCPEQ